MGVLHVSFGSMVRLRTFGFGSMGSVLLFILGSRLLLYSTETSEQSTSCFVWI